MNKRKLSFLTLGLLGLGGLGVILGVASNNMGHNVMGEGKTTWKHFEAVEETYETRGIKEYWTDCIGGQPVFEAPEGVVPNEGGVPSQEFIDSLDLDDPRLVRAVNEYERVKFVSGLQYVNTSNEYRMISSAEGVDTHYGPYSAYNMGSNTDYSQTNAFYLIQSQYIKEYGDKSFNLYIYSDVEFNVYYTQDWIHNFAQTTIKAGQWNKVSLKNGEYNYNGDDGYLYFNYSSKNLQELGTVKVTDLIVAEATNEIDVTPNLVFTYQDGADWPAIGKTSGIDAEYGEYSEHSLAEVPSAIKQVSVAVNAAACASFGDEVSFYVYSTCDFIQVVVQEAKEWSGPVTVCKVGWNKITLNSSLITLGKEAGMYINVSLVDSATSLLSEASLFRVSHFYSPVK